MCTYGYKDRCWQKNIPFWELGRHERKMDRGSRLQFFSKKDLRLIDTPKAEKLFEQKHFGIT